MKDNAPSGSDRNKAVSDTLPMLDEVLDLAPALETAWPSIRATIPAGTPVNDGGEGGGGGEAEEAPSGEQEVQQEGEPAGGGSEEAEESFIDSFDLDGVDPTARPAVEALQKEWQGQYTKRRQADREELNGVRREAEESQALIEGLRDPQTFVHYWQLLGIDLTNPQVLEQLGLGGNGQGGNQELEDLLDEEDAEDRISRIEQERAEERQQREHSEMEEALDEFADQSLEVIEQKLDRELTEHEDFLIRQRAEASPGHDGLPDYESAAKWFEGYLAQQEQGFAERRSQSGQRGAPGGKPGGKALDPTKEEDRIQLAAQAAERVQNSQK